MTGKGMKPNIFWLEGLLTNFALPFPYDDRDDPRRMGFSVGQQIVGLYLAEMLLKYALDNSGVPHGQHHNLHDLFRNLSRPRRRAVNRQYTKILNSEVDWTWNVAKTVDSLLRFLGKNAITDTRYFWDADPNKIILFSPSMLRPMIGALFIVLHNYPSKPIRKRYDTTFLSLAESLRGSSDPDSPPRPNREGKAMKLNVVWLEGVLDFFNAPFPYDDRSKDPRWIGFGVGQQTAGLYLTEMLLKYALDHSGVSYDQHHNLHRLFTDLPESHRSAVEQKYTEILNSETDSTWDVAETVDSLLTYLGRNAITDTRYFWEPDRTHVSEEASILFAPRMLRPLIAAIFIALHGYPYVKGSLDKRYDTTFQSLAESFKEDRQHVQSDPPVEGS